MHASPAPAPGSPAATRRDAIVRAVRTLGQTTIGGSVAAVLVIVATVSLDLFSTGEAVTVAMLAQAVLASLAALLLRRWEGRASAAHLPRKDGQA